jgi:hypothetical protein
MDAFDLLLLEIALLFLALVGLVVLEWRVCSYPRHAHANSAAAPGERAEALVRELLDEREYRQLKQRGYLDVVSLEDTQRIYRIPAYIGLVRVYERGMAVCELCVQSVDPLPSAELVLVHKLMIQADERKYRATARVYAYTNPDVRYHP